MKNTILKIAAALLLFMMGCSNDELIEDLSENNQLKQGFWAGMNFESISKNDGNFFPVSIIYTPEPSGQFKFLQNGSFWGNLQGYGKINRELSYYSISDIKQIPNGNYPLNSGQEFCYQITASGIIYITAKDFCFADVSDFIIVPSYHGPGYFKDFPNGFYGADVVQHGKITLHDGQGKLKGISMQITTSRGGVYTDTNLFTGQLRLYYHEHG